MKKLIIFILIFIVVITNVVYAEEATPRGNKFIPMDTMFKPPVVEEEEDTSLQELLQYFNELKEAGSWSPEGNKFKVPETGDPGGSTTLPPGTKPGATKPIKGQPSDIGVRLLEEVKKHSMGKPYVWGATGPNSFDCSGLFFHHANRLGITIPRTSRYQALEGTTVHFDNMQVGDLVFFNTTKGINVPSTIQNTTTGSYLNNKNVTHVGIYVGNNSFIHASTSRGVVQDTFTTLNGHYRKRFLNAQRY